MKKNIVLLVALLMTSNLSAQTVWKADPVHSNIEFTVTHMVISQVTGHFRDFTVTVTQGKDDFTDSRVDVAIKAASITTDNDMRDNHLRSSDFFDVANTPDITFKSTSFEKTGANTFKITGDLTMRGVTKNITLQATYLGQVKDQSGKLHAGFKASGSVDRYDFGLKWNRAVEAGGVLVSNKVDMNFNIQLIRQ